MNHLSLTTRVDVDGILRVPVGLAEANNDFRVTLERIQQEDDSIEAHRAFIKSIAGTWHGELERPPQLPLEERDPL